MAERTVEYTVGLMGISPKVRQDGGVQGDHDRVQLKFIIDVSLYNSLKEKEASSEGELYYRLDMYNGEGNCESTVAQPLAVNSFGDSGEISNNEIVLPLEEWITRYGGIIKVVLVLTLASGGETLEELYSFPAVLSLKSRPTASETVPKKYKSVSLMSVEATKAAEQAAEDAERAEQAARIAEDGGQLAKEYAEGLQGAVVIFRSNFDEEGNAIPFNLVVDGILSLVSSNPVQNKVVAEAIGNINDKILNLENFQETAGGDIESLKPEMGRISIPIKIRTSDGTSDSTVNFVWNYFEYDNGFVRLWGKCDIQLTVDTTEGNIHQSELLIIHFPFKLEDAVFSGMTTNEQWLINGGTDETSLWFRFARTNSIVTSRNTTFQIQAVGKRIKGAEADA